MSDRRNLIKDETGSAAVQFALVGPPFIAFLFGVIQLGWAMHCASSVRHALIAEARALSMNANMTANELQSAVRNDLTGVANSNVTVTLAQQTVGGVSASVATATYSDAIVIPLLGDYPVHFSSSVAVPRTQT